MIKVIRGAHRIPGEVHCTCGTTFEFEYEDIDRGTILFHYNSITCPVCNKIIELPDNLNAVCPWRPNEE